MKFLIKNGENEHTYDIGMGKNDQKWEKFSTFFFSHSSSLSKEGVIFDYFLPEIILYTSFFSLSFNKVVIPQKFMCYLVDAWFVVALLRRGVGAFCRLATTLYLCRSNSDR